MCYYHGTNINSFNKILKDNKMNPSRGDNHWLGDGVYFYDDVVYAYYWIYTQFNNRYKNNLSENNNIYNEFKIISSKLKMESEKIFNLDSIINKTIFDTTYENCVNKKIQSQRFKDCEMADGVVINIMFNELGYNKNYNVVIASFSRRTKNYENTNLRLHYSIEKQICVKDNGIIYDIIEYNYKDKITTYQNIIERFNYDYPNNIYKKNKRKIY